MSATSERELQARTEDLLRALKTIGQVLADDSVSAKRRIDQALGICRMYDAAPVPKETT